MARLGDLIKPAKVIRCDNSNYPVLSMTMHDGIILQSSRFKKSIASTDQSNYKVVQYGQLVVGFPIDEGVLYIQKVKTAGIMSPAYNVWDVETALIDINYLEYCLHSPQSMQFYKANLRGTTARRRSIPTDILLELFIPLPSLDEQRRIAALLDKVSDLITKRRAQLDKLDLLVKARFVEMFGDPISNEKNWPIVVLGDIAEILIGPFGSLLHKEDYIAGGHALVNPSHIIDGQIYIDEDLTVSDEKYDELSAYQLKIGDIVLGRRGEMGRCAVVYQGGLLCGTGSMIIRPNAQMKPYFLQNIISNPVYKKIIEDKAVGVTMMNLNVPIVSALKVPLLPVHLQEQFIDFMERVDKSKLTIQQSLDKLEILKKALMQQYFG